MTTWSLLLIAFLVSSSRGATIPTAVDESTCIDLCSSCDGVAKFEEGNCECSVDVANGTECLGRMKRQAHEYGLAVVSCDTDVGEARSARCTLGSKHSYGKNDMERVAKYFMQDGPMTGSVFIAPPYTTDVAKQAAESIVGSSAGGCGNVVGASQGIITQPAETMSSPNVGAPLITQPKNLIPLDPLSLAAPASLARVGAPAPAARIPGPLGTPSLQSLGLQEIAPQFLSMLGEVITKPILGLPQAIQSVSEVPGMSDLVGAPANLLNSLADQMAEKSQAAKDNLDNFREVVGKAKDDVMVGLANLKESKKAMMLAKSNPTVGSALKSSKPSYSIMNPQPMLSWLNPTVGAPTPTQFVSAAPMQTAAQFVGSPAPMQFLGSPMQTTQFFSAMPSQMVGSPAPSAGGQMVGSSLGQLIGAPPMQFLGAALPQLLSAAHLVSAMPSQLVGTSSPGQMVGAPNPSGSSDCGGQMVGSPASFPNQMVGSPMAVIQSLGTIPLSSIVGQMSPTYLVGSPMTTYYSSAVQTDNTVGEANPEPSLEEVPLSSPPQKKICKKSTRDDEPSMKYSRDVKAVEKQEEEETKVEEPTTTTTTTEVPMIERTTTQKPKVSVIAKIKPASKKIKAEKNVETKL